MRGPSQTVEAAGGVLWRAAQGGGVEVALVHRPKYDDWSLPKGKLGRAEHPLLGALREVKEETGSGAVPGRPLGELRYTAFGAPKRVRYWACRATTGTFVPGREVDEVVWSGLADADARLSADRDRSVLRRFSSELRPTVALVVARHASAGDPDAWPADDTDRPLDPRGREQAVGLAGLLQAYAVKVAVTADVRRCRDTLAPFHAATGVPVRTDPALTVGAARDQPAAGVSALLALAGGPAAVVCSQRELIPDVVAGACARLGRPVRPEQVGEPDKGSLVVLHLSGDREPRLVDWESLPPVG